MENKTDSISQELDPQQTPAAPAEQAQPELLDDQILQLQKQLEELRRQKQIEQQKKQDEERKRRQIAALQAAIRAEQESETVLASAPAAAEPQPCQADPAAPEAEFETAASARGADDEKNPFVQAARESAAPQSEESADKKDEDPFYTGKPAFATGTLKQDKKTKKEKKPKKPKVDLATLPREHNGIFRGLAAASPLILLVMLLLVCWTPALMGDLACPREVENIKVLGSVSGLALLPHAGDLALMPVFGLISWACSLLPLPSAGLCLPIVSFVGAAVCLLGLCVFCGSLRLGRHVMFGAGLILLCLPLFLSMANFIGPVPLACGLSLMAMGLICRGWMNNFDFPGMVLGNVLAAAAVLTGGLYFGLVPVVSGFLFAIWRGNMARLRNTDAVAGLVVFVALILLWLGCVILFGADDITTDMLLGVLLSTPDSASFIKRLCVALVAFCPFILIVITANWGRLIARSVSNIRASRSENASAYIWIALVLALLFSSFSSLTADIFLAVCLLAVLCARCLLDLGLFGTRGFFLLVSLVLLCLSLVLVVLMVPFAHDLVMPAVPQLAELIPAEAQTWFARVWNANSYLCVALCLCPFLMALIISHVAWRSRTAAAPLLVTAVTVLVLAQPFGLYMPQIMVQVPALQLTGAAAALTSGLEAAPAEAVSAEEAKPAEAAPAEEAKPAEAAPAEEAKPAEAAPAEEAKPAEAAPAEEAKPADAADAAPAEEAKSAEAAEAPAEAPAETPAEGTAPADVAK